MLQNTPLIQSRLHEHFLPPRQESPDIPKVRPKTRRYRDDLVKKILDADQATPPASAMSGKEFLTWLDS